MTFSATIKIIASLAAAVFFIGCAKVPEQKLAGAQSAIELAKSAGADQYASPQLTSAQSAFDNATAAILAENKKPFLRNYDDAVNQLDIATEFAQQAYDIAKKEQDRIRAEQEKARMESAKKKGSKSRQSSKKQ